MAHKTKNIGQSPSGNTLTFSNVASINLSENSMSCQNKSGRQIDHVSISDKQGKTSEDVAAFVRTVVDHGCKFKNPLLHLINGNYVRCSAIEALEQHSGRDHKGIVIRSEGDAILGFIEIPTVETRERVANVLHDTLEAYAVGKFTQPDWVEILNVTTETN
ncbi:hypothetical protein [Photobacterium sanguinicancri]|uniref:Uncharacterized protein n=1 Tax=Photobacterium sanguinicancri TaxID=875932 RepID=A0ABX4FVY5_9GAMM|nr:hypothetical protein [Photobacterium sanguinicancri]OZS42485.1 hypothetical protein ASV53_18180 [Photobacterium sanguinicancri]